MEFDPKCERVEESTQFGNVVLHSVNYDLKSELCLTLQMESSAKGDFQLIFDSPRAVRVIDEGQICEFWNTCSSRNGWLWKVLDGGWVALESQRHVFWENSVTPECPISEYLVVGDQCVFVMTYKPPRFALKSETASSDCDVA